MPTIDDYLTQANEKDPEQVSDALTHLANFKDVRARTAIQNAFFHRHTSVRQAAAEAAGACHHPDLLDALLSLLDDAEPEVRLAAMNALGEYPLHGANKRILLEVVQHQPDVQTDDAADRLLIKAGDPAIPLLEMELTSFDEKRRERAIRNLPNMGELGIMALVAHIPEMQRHDKMMAARKLNEHNHPMLRGYLLKLLKDEDSSRRNFALIALEDFSPEAIQLVGEILLHDPDQTNRLAAINYLKWSKNPAILPFLDAFDAQAEKGLEGKWMRESVRDAYCLLDLQNKPLEELIWLLFMGEDHERPLCAVEFSRREDPLAIPFLARCLLVDRSHDVQGHTLIALSDLEAVEEVDAIMAFFDRPRNSREDALALRVLGYLWHPKALDLLKARAGEALYNDFPALTEPVQSAREAVKTIEERLEGMHNMWFMENEQSGLLRRFIALSLAMRGDERGVDLLMKDYPKLDMPALRYQTLRALGSSGSVFVLPFLKEVLKSKEEREVCHAVLAIGQLPLKAAPPELTALLLDNSPLLRMMVLIALGKIRDPKSLPIILRRLQDFNPFVRAMAVQTLGQFPFSKDWLPNLDMPMTNPSDWMRLETARLLARERITASRSGLARILMDPHPLIRQFAVQIAEATLAEDLRPALEICANIKGGRTSGKARELLERLNWQAWSQDPELLQQKRLEAAKKKQEEERKRAMRRMRYHARYALLQLKEEGWQSVMVTNVAGSSYVDWEVLYKPLKVGDTLLVRRQPDNVIDSNAIQVQDQAGQKLGFIPQYRNHKLAKQMDQGTEAQAVVLAVDCRGRVGSLTIEVFIHGQEG